VNSHTTKPDGDEVHATATWLVWSSEADAAGLRAVTGSV